MRREWTTGSRVGRGALTMPHPDGLHRPSPVAVDTPAEPVDRSCDPERVAQALCEGRRQRITDLYGTGNTILGALRARLSQAHPGKDHAQRRAYRRALHEAGRHLLAPVQDNAIALAKAPDIGWLEELYPDQANFMLPFGDLMGLNSAWQWRLRGLKVPILRTTIHPFYGTYFPTRFDHLELFNDWLKEQDSLQSIVDVGVGSGVLTVLLLQRGAQHVYATDLNPNALISAQGELRGRGHKARVTFEQADLLGSFGGDADLIVFNPPWLPGEVSGPLDMAIYYPDDLFSRFFREAHQRLAPGGRVALLFSNLVGQLTPNATHPVEQELATGGRFVLEDKHTRSVRAGSKRTKRSTAHRSQEQVQLWILTAQV